MDKKEYMKVSEAAVKWGISTRRVRLLCSEGRIAGAWRKGGYYLIPADATRPSDGRVQKLTKNDDIPLLRQVCTPRRMKTVNGYSGRLVFYFVAAHCCCGL